MRGLTNFWIRAGITLAVSLSLWSCAKKNGVDEDDGNTPYVILDLRVATTTDSSITLYWTATGDDADVGTASVYDIRYYRNWISSINWDSATEVMAEPKPRPAGETDTMVVRGLEKDTTYFFALKVSDEAGNWTNQSNCVSGTCFEDLVVTFTDPNLEAAVRTAINKPTGDIRRTDLMTVTFLEGNNRGITTLTGVEYCRNLSVLFMSTNEVSDLTPLADLTKLFDVQFFDNNISNIAPLAKSLNIERLILAANSVSDISTLSGHYRLHILGLNHNLISDLSPLVQNLGFADGDTVYLNDNPLSQTSIDVLIPQLQNRGATVIR